MFVTTRHRLTDCSSFHRLRPYLEICLGKSTNFLLCMIATNMIVCQMVIVGAVLSATTCIHSKLYSRCMGIMRRMHVPDNLLYLGLTKFCRVIDFNHWKLFTATTEYHFKLGQHFTELDFNHWKSFYSHTGYHFRFGTIRAVYWKDKTKWFISQVYHLLKWFKIRETAFKHRGRTNTNSKTLQLQYFSRL